MSLDVCEAGLDLAPQPLLGILWGTETSHQRGRNVRLISMEPLRLAVWMSALDVGGGGVRGGGDRISPGKFQRSEEN